MLQNEYNELITLKTEYEKQTNQKTKRKRKE